MGSALRAILLLVCALLLVVLTTILAMGLAEQRLRSDSRALLLSQKQSINDAIDRVRPLPVAIANHPHVISTLLEENLRISNMAGTKVLSVNQYLKSVGQSTNASLLYVLDKGGYTRAASNWLSDKSLIGNRYVFRPYFKQALQGGESRYYGVGVTTHEAGFYVGQPIIGNHEIIGVAVAKTELESTQLLWESGSSNSLLVDEHGVSIITSNPSWRYRAVRELNQADLIEFTEQRKYDNHSLSALFKSGSLSEGRMRIDSKKYFSTQIPLPDLNWTIVQLIPYRAVYQTGAIAALTTILLLATAVIAYLYRRERHRKNMLSAAAQDAATMRVLNQKLEVEITERERAELELRDAQSELIQASKLAALGQMSAAIAHEVNQPLSAIRTFSASATLLLQRNRTDEVYKNLEEIKALTERLATLTSDLKIFARKSDSRREPTELQPCLEAVSALLKADLIDRNITLSCRVPEQVVTVMGSAIRIEQVLSNLLRNAMDASNNVDRQGHVLVDITIEGPDAVIRVQDNGKGLDEQALEHVFEPFFTTKPLGEGVGLGLAISYGIVEELGGQLRVRNVDEGGALFSVRLPYVQPSNAPDANRKTS